MLPRHWQRHMLMLENECFPGTGKAMVRGYGRRWFSLNREEGGCLLGGVISTLAFDLWSEVGLLLEELVLVWWVSLASACRSTSQGLTMQSSVRTGLWDLHFLQGYVESL